MSTTIETLMRDMLEAEDRSTQGEWRVRELPGSDQFFVERPRQPGEAYGVDVLGDDDYPTKRGDADFIVAAKKLAMALRQHGGALPPGAA